MLGRAVHSIDLPVHVHIQNLYLTSETTDLVPGRAVYSIDLPILDLAARTVHMMFNKVNRWSIIIIFISLMYHGCCFFFKSSTCIYLECYV